jgi:hypothetical protein
MRTTKELLEVIITKSDLLNVVGVCKLSKILQESGYMTRKELEKISDFLDENLPPYRYDVVYCWPVGEKEPRIKWIKEQIEKLTKHE